MMYRKKKIIYLATTLVTSLVMLLSLVFDLNNGQFVFADFLRNGSATWVHYARREPTEEAKGIKEYWVQCGGTYQFTAPTSGTIVEGSGYDTSEFLENDDRWIPNEIDCDADFWEGKKWVALGTSITSTRDTNNDGVITGEYPNTLEALSGMVQTNYGVEGANMGGHPFLYSLFSTYRTTIKNADVITIEGGVNDWFSSKPLGTINDVMPYYNDWTKGGINLVTGHSTGTFAGSCYSLFSNIKSLNPTAIIIVLTDCSGPDGGICAANRTNSRGLYLSDYSEMMLDIADLVGVKSIDAGANCGITGQDSQYFTDHIHLNAAGGEVYANYVWQQMLTFTKKVHDTKPTVTVTFKTNNETINTQTFERGLNAYAPYPGTYENRDFLSFDKSLKNITADTVINTVWSDNKYTITFDTDGGSTISSITGFAGDPVGAISNPTKSGYVFDGWDKTIPSVIPNQDLTITALWREPDNLFHRLDETKGKRLMMNGSDGSVYEYSQSGYNLSDAIAVNNKKLTIEFDVDTVKGAQNYASSSFNLIPSDSLESLGVPYSIFYESYSAQNEYFSITRNGTHYVATFEGRAYIRIAYESANLHNLSVKYATYTVTFSDGENIISTQEVTYGNDAVAPSTPTKEGYVFDGWDRSFTNIRSAITVTALWREPDNLFHRLDETKGKRLMMNGSDGSIYEYSQAGYNLSDVIAVNGKKLIIEFDVDTVKNVNMYSQASFNIIPTNSVESLGASYSIFYESYSGQSQYFAVTRTDNHYVVTWNGYNYVRIAYESANLHNLSVKYATYTVTFSDGENVISEQTVIYGEAAIAPEDPTKEGYIFDGWDRAFNNVTSNITVTAKWKDEDELFDSSAVLTNTFINSTVNGTASGYCTSNYFARNRNEVLRIDITRKNNGSLSDFRIALGASNNDKYLGAWQVNDSSTLFTNDVYEGPHIRIVRTVDGSHTIFIVTNLNRDMHYVRFSYKSAEISAISVKAVS